MKRPSDTDIFRGLKCEVCQKPVLLSHNSAVWRSYPETKGWHWKCWERVAA